MSQKFTNSYDGTLAALLTAAGTSATLTDAAALSEPTGGAFELLTISNLGQREIVRMTGRTGNTITITRAQEGTTAQEWPAGSRVFAGITAGTLLGFQEPAPFRVGSGSVASGSGAIAVGTNVSATGTSSVAVGIGSTAAGTKSLAIGGSAQATSGAGGFALAIGEVVTASGNYTVSVGENSFARAQGATSLGGFADSKDEMALALGCAAKSGDTEEMNSIAVGAFAEATKEFSIAIGSYAWAKGLNSIQLGHYGNVFGDDCIQLGNVSIDPDLDHIYHVGALPAVPRSWHAANAGNAHYIMVGDQSVIMTERLPFTATTIHTITIPSAARFYVDEVGVIITNADTVTTQPTVRWGITGDTEKFVAATLLTGLDAAHKRQRFTSIGSPDGAGTLRVEITVAGAATDLRGRFYWKGFAVVAQNN